MISKQRPLLKLAPAALTIVIGCAAAAQSSLQSGVALSTPPGPPVTAADSIGPTEHSAQLDTLRSRLDDRTSLFRLQTLAAIDASIAIDDETAGAILQDTLHDRDPLVAEAALAAILHRGDDQLYRIRAADLENSSGETRELAQVRMSSLGQDVSALRDLMKNGNAPVQQAAFEAWASNDTSAAISALKEEFLDATSLHRLATLELMVSSPYTSSPAVLLPVLESASSDPDPLVKERAMQMLREKNSEARSGLPSGLDGAGRP